MADATVYPTMTGPDKQGKWFIEACLGLLFVKNATSFGSKLATEYSLESDDGHAGYDAHQLVGCA